MHDIFSLDEHLRLRLIVLSYAVALFPLNAALYVACLDFSSLYIKML